jgi:hypothetical protein
MIGNSMQTAAERELTEAGIAALVILVVLLVVAWSSDRSHLDASSRMWRWLHLFPTGLVVVLGIDLLPDLAEETEWTHRADELAIIVLAGLAIVWYAGRRRRLARSLAPLCLVVIGEAIKLFAILIEWRDTADVQADIVLAVLGVPVVATLVVIYSRIWRRHGAPGVAASTTPDNTSKNTVARRS